MCKHEAKKCPRCNGSFECKVGDVTHCQCFGISLDTEQRAFLEARYGECLCRSCLLELSQKDIFFKEKHAWHEHR